MRKEHERDTAERVSQTQIYYSAGHNRSERRVSLRYALHARVVFAWDDPQGEKHESRGHTRDLGQKGAFVFAKECPERDTAISLSIFLPVTGSEKRVLRLEVKGKVLRSGVPGAGANVNGPASLGFAVSHQRVNLFSS
jgi:hypothetical protein